MLSSEGELNNTAANGQQMLTAAQMGRRRGAQANIPTD
jgi:hypothetical protein